MSLFHYHIHARSEPLLPGILIYGGCYVFA